MSTNITIGMDFGTSYTKICVGIKEERKEISKAIPFKGTKLENALLLSKIGIKEDGTLLAGLTENELVIAKKIKQ